MAMDVQNENCILVEFVNENRKTQTCYLCWLSKDDQENIEQIIRDAKVVVMMWPHVNAAEASIMKIRLRNTEWTAEPVIILAQGGNYQR